MGVRLLPSSFASNSSEMPLPAGMVPLAMSCWMYR
jgi:hypothetical protein